jgi:hypothetical protein
LHAVVEKVGECWSEGYVLRHCTGFRVEVLLDPEEDAPEALLVRGTSTVVIPLSQIVRVVPGQEHVLVAAKVRT